MHATGVIANKFSARRLAVAALLVMGVAVGAACSETEHRADLDRGLRCEATGSRAHAAGSVTNHSSETSTYIIAVSFDDGTRVAKKTAIVEDVPAGDTATFDTTAAGYRPSSKVACTVTSVDGVKA